MIARIIKRIIRDWRIRSNPINYARSIGVTIGDDCKLVQIGGGTFGSEPYLVSMGNHVEISGEVRFITHDGCVWVARMEHPDIDVVARIRIGNNVFIGARSILLPGTTIGDNCVVGAGSVVRGNIDSGTVVAGVPARFICSTGDYVERSLARNVHTKHMSQSEKKAYLSQNMV